MGSPCAGWTAVLLSRQSVVVQHGGLVERVPTGRADRHTEVATLLGASRITARRYLEYLADAGPAGRDHRCGGAGRPQVGGAP